MGKQWKQCQTLFFWAPKSLQIVTAVMVTLTPWKKSYDKPREHIKKHRHNFADTFPCSQRYGSATVMYRCELDHKSTEELMLLNCGAEKDS